MGTYHYILIIYLAGISLFNAVLFTLDKINSISKNSRVPEAVLLTLAFFGGAFVQYLLLFVLRHKNRKPKFYVSLPLFVIIHIVLIWFLWTRVF